MASINFADISPINKVLPIPLYYQIAGVLREVIQASEVLMVDEGEIPLPTEEELSEFFEVHRGTLRHALDILVREGLIYRERGRGTFLHRRRVQQDLSTLLSTTEDLEQRGWIPSTRLLEIKKDFPRPHTQHVLNIEKDRQVWDILRLRLANGEPIGVQRGFIPVELTPDLEKYDLEKSLSKTIEKVYGIVFKQADQTIRARKATTAESKLLKIKIGDPLIIVTCISWDQYGRPIEDLDSYWRFDRYDLRIRHTRA